MIYTVLTFLSHLSFDGCGHDLLGEKLSKADRHEVVGVWVLARVFNEVHTLVDVV